MRAIFLITLFFVSFSGLGQKLHKLDGINDYPLTLNPTIFDPNQDSTIAYIEFLQDTTAGTYEEKIYSSITNSDRGIERMYGIGLIKDFRIDKKTISVIIKTHYKNGSSASFKYIEKIDKLLYYDDFEWSMYSPDVEILYDEEASIVGS